MYGKYFNNFIIVKLFFLPSTQNALPLWLLLFLWFSYACKRLDTMCRVRPFQCIWQIFWKVTGGCLPLHTAHPRYVNSVVFNNWTFYEVKGSKCKMYHRGSWYDNFLSYVKIVSILFWSWTLQQVILYHTHFSTGMLFTIKVTLFYVSHCDTRCTVWWSSVGHTTLRSGHVSPHWETKLKLSCKMRERILKADKEPITALQ